MRLKITIFLSIFVLMFSCKNNETVEEQNNNLDKVTVSGKIVVFHAGSLSYTLRILKEKFEKKFPGTEILLEGAGSLECAGKIIDLKKHCDIFASADYKIIDDLIIPEYAEKNNVFASNEIVVAYSDESKYASEISEKNWYDLLLRSDVKFGRSEPDNDPCGYRTVMTWQLAEKYYKNKGLEYKFLKKNTEFVRPKEVDLLALIQSGSIDYMFIYKSLAFQHHLKFITFPDEINLGNPKFADFYKNSAVKVKGKKPGETKTFIGEQIVYGITLLKEGKKNAAAKAFLDFILSEEGKKIIFDSGFKTI